MLNTWHDEFLNQVRMFNLTNYCVVWAWLQIVVQFLIYYLDIIVLADRWFCTIYWLSKLFHAANDFMKLKYAYILVSS
jgi:hypothetical protein